MGIIFQTENLDQKLYKNIFKAVLNNLDTNVPQFFDEWTITIYKLDSTNTAYFGHVVTTDGTKINPTIPSGVTGKFDMKLWLHDDKNEFMTRENSDRIQHELCHAVLLLKYGTKGKIDWVKDVHNNVSKRFILNLWYWKGVRLIKLPLSIIDIRLFLY